MAQRIQRVIVDGIELGRAGVKTEIMSYDFDLVGDFSRNHKTNVKMTITTEDSELRFHVQSIETDQDGTLHVYGPFRKMFPQLFTALELYDWQKAYLTAYKMNDLQNKVWNDDPLFTTEQAITFQRGYEYGKKEVS